ncbi:hypothetical protein K435DRAFT_816228 [Dendrothele bispora CBS 962.96]|uniref:Integrase core domain-containing protein n=1 Tax=Dendrothele bispora (strain CBS 962.96) TaxID=1314807 RepID=A0A4S8MSH3_DENBC|nr:hypothetical protein K435DRAFT_816228 [Dendrothele bispora CBS 962.96]
MEQYRGTNRGSYIWGRSVHNTRIERLWYDVTSGFGAKWKNFFLELEVHHHLNPQNSAHIWLLHHLFIDHINQDAQEWAMSWNSHNLRIQGERERSPRDIFFFSILQDGPRGLYSPNSEQLYVQQPANEDPDDLVSYGVDYDTNNDRALMAHHVENNPSELEDNFQPGGQLDPHPSNFSKVDCVPPSCPFTLEEVNLMDSLLSQHVDTSSRNMGVRRLIWDEALQIATELYSRHSV